MTDTTQAAPTVDNGQVERRAKLLSGLDSLRTRASVGSVMSERTLMVAGGVLAPIGVFLIFLGWLGAANTPYLFEQVPYLISGGLIGLGLCILGGFLYFAHWITELVKEQRRHTDEVVGAIDELRDQITELATAATAAATAAANGTTSTSRGSRARRDPSRTR